MFICKHKVRILAGLLALATQATAGVQQVRFEPIIVSGAAGETLDFELRYGTDPATAELTGLGLRLHWDSNRVSFGGFNPIANQALLGVGTPQPDTRDFDANPATDRFVVVAWADPAAGWPGFTDGVLGAVTVTLAPDFSATTTLGLSSTSTPVGWGLGDIPATIADPGIDLPPPELVFDKRWLSVDGRPGIDFGGEAFFELELTNPGLIGIDAINVADPLAPDCARAGIRLLAGESQTWQCSVANVMASFVNQATASGTALNDSATPVEVMDSAEVPVLDPLLAVTIDPPTQMVRAGEDAAFNIAIRNDSADPLNQLQITSTEVPACDLSLDTLDAGAETSWSCVSENVQQDFVNRIQATAVFDGSIEPTLLNQVEAEVQAIDPAIALELEADPDPVETGGTVEFTMRLINTGDTGLTELGVTSPDQPDCQRQFSALDAGVTLEWNCSRSDVQDAFTLTAEATALPPVGAAVVDNAEVSVETFVLIFRNGFE